MNWNYESYILSKLTAIQREKELSDFNFEIETEQAFVKRKDYAENTIYIIIKYLSDSKQFGATTQPVQFLILSEQNSLEVAKILFSTFAKDYNWKVEIEGSEYIKQQYSEPVVLSNFNPVMYGYRSVMYMTATLTIMEDVLDVNEIWLNYNEEDEQKLDCVAFNLAYTMNTNTQQLASEEIASSTKTVSTLAITLTIPFQEGTVVERFLNILDESENGDSYFSLTFKIGSDYITKDMKLTSAQLTTAINQVPALQLGFMK